MWIELVNIAFYANKSTACYSDDSFTTSVIFIHDQMHVYGNRMLNVSTFIFVRTCHSK